jgi:hypothetical protein
LDFGREDVTGPDDIKKSTYRTLVPLEPWGWATFATLALYFLFAAPSLIMEVTYGGLGFALLHTRLYRPGLLLALTTFIDLLAATLFAVFACLSLDSGFGFTFLTDDCDADASLVRQNVLQHKSSLNATLIGLQVSDLCSIVKGISASLIGTA